MSDHSKTKRPGTIGAREDLFVPPDGAMQFEVLRGWEGEPVPKEYAPLVCWVERFEGRFHRSIKSDCPCTVCFIVFEESMPPELRSPHPGHPHHFCACVGRIIE